MNFFDTDFGDSNADLNPTLAAQLVYMFGSNAQTPFTALDVLDTFAMAGSNSYDAFYSMGASNVPTDFFTVGFENTNPLPPYLQIAKTTHDDSNGMDPFTLA